MSDNSVSNPAPIYTHTNIANPPAPSVQLAENVVEDYKTLLKGYWRPDIHDSNLENLAVAHQKGAVDAKTWNRFGDATVPWERQDVRLKKHISDRMNTSSEEPVADVSSGNGPEQEITTVAAGTYTVKRGDTLSKIAEQHGISLKDLIELNKGDVVNPNAISVGQKIKIPLQNSAAEAPDLAEASQAAEERIALLDMPQQSTVPSSYAYLLPDEEPPQYEPEIPQTAGIDSDTTSAPAQSDAAVSIGLSSENPVIDPDMYEVVPGEIPDSGPVMDSARSVISTDTQATANPYETVDLNPDGTRSASGIPDGTVVDIPLSGEEVIARSLLNIGSEYLLGAVPFAKKMGTDIISVSRQAASQLQMRASGFISRLFPGTTVYKVGKGETLTGIAKQAGISAAKLLWDNRNNLEGTKIRQGAGLLMKPGTLSGTEKLQADIYYANAVRLDNPLLHPDLRRLAPAMFEIFEKNGYMVEIYSDFRTFERQAELNRSNKWPAAPAGYSDHNWGLALDVRIYKKDANGNLNRIAATSIPGEIAKKPEILQALKGIGIEWEGAADPMHFSVGTVKADYPSLIARRNEAIGMIGAKGAALTPAQQRIVMYYVRSYQENPSLAREERLKLAMNNVPQ